MPTQRSLQEPQRLLPTSKKTNPINIEIPHFWCGIFYFGPMKNTLLLVLALAVGNLFGQSKKLESAEVEIEEFSIWNGDTIKGTLVLNGLKKSYKKMPLVIIIPGSGPTDRNGNSAVIPGDNNSYKQLAHALREAGVASFRYDKPGIGASKTNVTEADLRFETNAEMLLSVIHKMQKIGFKKIYLIGHSEGSLIGMLASQKEKVSGYISLAGISNNILDVLKVQLGNLPDGLKQQAFQKLDSIHEGHTVTKFNPMLASLLRPSVQPYLQSWMKYSPSEEIQKLDIPVMIIQGGRDVQVATSEGEALHKAVPEALYKFYPEMNHVLKMVDETEAQNRGSYGDPDFPLQTGMAKDIAEWIDAH